MNKAMKERLNVIMEKINSLQDIWYVIRFSKDFEVYIGTPDNESVVKYHPEEWIGFYEWIFNQKYMVFQKIFKKEKWFVEAQDIAFDILEGAIPEDIIKHFYNTIKEGT